MKKWITSTILTVTCTATYAQIIAPKTANQGIEELKKSVIQMIKNEKAKPIHKKPEFTHEFEDESTLNAAVQLKLIEANDVLHLRDHKTFDDALTFMSLAYKAWNPELRDIDLKKQFKKNIAHFGFINGFVTPAMALMDLSYATKMPQFGGLLNLMLNDISPSIAMNLNTSFGIPLEFNNLNFTTLRNQGRDGMWQTLVTGLDPAFYDSHNKMASAQELKNTINPLLSLEPTMDTFLDNTLKTKSSYLNVYLTKMGHKDSTSNILGNREKMKGAFSSATEKDPVSCQAKCYEEIKDRAKYSVPVGAAAGAKVGTLGGPKGTLVGGIIGGTAGLGVAAYVGYNECKSSIQCGGEGSDKDKTDTRENEARAQEAEAKAKEAQAKAKEAEIRVKEKETQLKEKETRTKEAEAKKKEADEKVKSAKANADAAMAKVKLAEEELKTAKDKNAAQEKIAKAKLEKEQAEKKLAQAKKEQNEAAENEKKQKEEAEKQSNELEEDRKKAAEVKDDKQMVQNEDGGKKLSIAEIKERKENYSSTPRIPPEDGTVKLGLQNNFDLNTKKIDKDSNSEQKTVNIVYPANPNAGD